MRKFTILFLLSFFALQVNTYAQVFTLTTANQQETTCDGDFFDNNTTGNYSTTTGDKWITFTQDPASVAAGKLLLISFQKFDVRERDTLFIYDGDNINAAPFLIGDKPFANNSNPISSEMFFMPSKGSSGKITIRLKTTGGTGTAAGWNATVKCDKPRQRIEADIEPFFYKNNDMLTAYPVKPGLDIRPRASDSTQFDTIHFQAIDICAGDSITIKPNPRFPDDGDYYSQSKTLCNYIWRYGDRVVDTTYGDVTTTHKYGTVTGYNLTLKVVDQEGSYSTNNTNIRVRIAKNPVKAVAPIADMCTSELIKIDVGDTPGSKIRSDESYNRAVAIERYDSAIFIPDGGATRGGGCYESTVDFRQFGDGVAVQSGQDILSVCINMEHSFPGDLAIYLECPTGKVATLMSYNGSTSVPGLPTTTPPNGGNHLGIANKSDATTGTGTLDPARNPPGIGWDYCWSEKYDNSRGRMGPLTRAVIGPGGSMNPSPIDSTDYNKHSNFFRPDKSFDSLVGCPLDGTWKIRVCDYWEKDNGWVFSWSLEFDNISKTDWVYSVGIDTVMFRLDSVYGDGKEAQDSSFIQTATREYITIQPTRSSYPDKFIYRISIQDSFACVWDTATSLRVIATPIVTLKHDTALCEGQTMLLDAGNPTNTTYLWEPTGETTQTIRTLPNIGSPEVYKVIVVRTEPGSRTVCKGSAQSIVKLKHAPASDYITNLSPLPLEGCAPLPIIFYNISAYSDSVEWYFNDKLLSTSDTVDEEFPLGNTSLKVIAYNNQGCSDTITHNDIIKVYASPKPDFRWSPQYPTAAKSTVHFINKTTPGNPADYRYVWQIQNTPKDPNSFKYITDSVNLTYPFKGSDNKYDDVSGDYAVYLIAKNSVTGASGYSYECTDTAKYQVAIFNEFLQFPNAVTPNGDGVNDVFAVKSLVSGRYYPNNELVIRDRWGRTIFSRKNIREATDVWNPKESNVGSGTYFYTFIGKGLDQDIEYNGAIEVIMPK